MHTEYGEPVFVEERLADNSYKFKRLVIRVVLKLIQNNDFGIMWELLNIQDHKKTNEHTGIFFFFVVSRRMSLLIASTSL